MREILKRPPSTLENLVNCLNYDSGPTYPTFACPLLNLAPFSPFSPPFPSLIFTLRFYLFIFTFLCFLSSSLSPFFPRRRFGLLSASQPTSKARNNLLKCVFRFLKRSRVFSIFPNLFPFGQSE